MMNICRIDIHPLGGIAGDMFAAAMFDAWPELYSDFKDDLARLSIQGLDVSLEACLSKGLHARTFSVVQRTEQKPPRTVRAVKDFLQATTLEKPIVQTAIEIYQLLGEAEAAVHGKTVETIHFHEVSDWDSMVDIIAAAGAIVRVQCPHWRISPLPLGGGTINTAHGDIPLPAPATVAMLKGYDWIDDGQAGERVTPTGAAIVAYLKPAAMGGAAAARLACIGNGCGTRELADRANIVRVSAFVESDNTNLPTEPLVILEFEIDDMTPEELADACDHLRDSEGVADVSTIAMQGKKGRHSTGVRILVAPGHKDQLINDCFIRTSTLGVRYTTVDRYTLDRCAKKARGVRVKVATRPGEQLTAKAESDDLHAVDSLEQRRSVAAQTEGDVLLECKSSESDND